MNFSQWVQGHRLSILYLIAVLSLSGLAVAFSLPVTLFPTVDFPRVRVSLDAGDRPAPQMETQVTVPVEEAIRRVPGVKNVRSTTSRGSADISISFDWGTDMGLATAQINEAATQLLPSLPPGTSFQAGRMDPTVFPVIAYSITSPSLSLTKLYDIAQYQLRPLLSGISGLARVEISGGAPEEYLVSVDPEKILFFGITLEEVSNALAAANVIAATGRIEDHTKLYLAVSDSQLKTLDDIRNTVLKTGPTGFVRVGEVAQVMKSSVPAWIRVTADGHDAVLLDVYQQPGSNSVQISHDVKEKLASFQSQLPPDVKIADWYDQSALVTESAFSVRDAILIGIVLAALVLLIFLRNLKITLIAILVVPTALASTLVLLKIMGMSFNIMTLGGMAAAVGLIIDDAIVMIEHIVRRLRGAPAKHHGRVMAAAREFIRPLSGSSASTVIIFLPLAFLSGVTGAFFKALSLTMASGLIMSFFVTWLAVPLLADQFLNEKDANQEEQGRWFNWFQNYYTKILRRLLATPLLAMTLVAPLLGAGALAYQAIGSGFMPTMDEGGFVLDYLSAPGTSLAETDRLLLQVEAIIQDTPEVETYSRRTGIQLGGGLTEANEGDFFIRLKDGPRRDIEEIMDEIRGEIEAQVPGLSIELLQLMEDLIGDLTAVPQPIEVKLFSDDAATLAVMAEKTAAAISEIPGVVDVQEGINPAGDALAIQFDRDKAALEGLDTDSATKQLSHHLTGNIATQIQQGPKMIGVRVWIPEKYRAMESDIGRIQLRAADGHRVPVARVASITKVAGQPQINRENLKRMVAVTARITGRDMGSIVQEVKQKLDQPAFLPRGLYYELGGLYQEQRSAFRGLISVFAASVALVFLLLLFLYEQLRMAIATLAIPLLSVLAVFTGLWISGIELNISALMGMTMIIGIVTEVAIFYFSEYQDLTAKGMDWEEALFAAGRNRMRPITMTTLAAILTLLPLAFALGQGSAMQQPLAVAIISGLIVQLPLTLFVMPTLFHALEKRRRGR